MKKERPKKLRWRLARALIASTLLLWLGFVLLVYNNRLGELEDSVSNIYQRTKNSLRQSTLTTDQENRASGLGARADHMLMFSLSNLQLDGIYSIDGGTALAVQRGETLVRSQITWGLGYEASSEQPWYLYFDQGLDDQGQMEFTRWMMAHRSGWSYELFPPGESPPGEVRGESTAGGTFARITGVELPGGGVQVQFLDLIHPDGSQERVLETDTPGQSSITLDLTQMEVRSVLLPSRLGDGRDGPIHMERRLASFREAQAIIDRDRAGEQRPVIKTGGQLSAGIDQYGISYWHSVYCNLRPVVLEEQWGLYLISFGFAAAVMLILSAHLSKKVTEPVETLSQEAQEGRCREDGPVRELNALARAFNAAQEQLEGQLSRERAFTRGAAHELKTPLAVLRTHAEALREDIAPEKRERYLDIILEESDRMATLVGSLLELSRLESGIALNKEPLDLSALTRKVFAPLELALQQKKISLRLDLPELWIEGDRERLKRAIENLASNALRHCTSGGCIQVALNVSGDGVRLLVLNDGPAISEQDLPHLWEPFYRGDQARSRDTGGTGLGLAIVRAAIQAHGGSCGVENGPHNVSFWFCLPSSVLLE